ncbi:MAG: hypothetical protein R3C27_15090 [Hyphomonadaceae bacterium]
MSKSKDQYSEAEAKKRFEQALKGAANLPPKKIAKPKKTAKKKPER